LPLAFCLAITTIFNANLLICISAKNSIISPLNIFEKSDSCGALALLETDIKSKQIIIQTSVDSSKDVCISIKDNGNGISPEIKERIFNPFFTTKPIGKGTGLGLSISHQIIENHQGTINVISELAKGTEFTIKIPIS
jgi:signal transduction histidine kinase